jgi:hypothetical protein
MSDIKSNLKTLTKEIFDKMDKLQLHIDHLTKGLIDLLNEDDIVSLPSYQLLKSVYSEYLNDKPEQAKTKEEKIDQMYNPLYAPSTSRRKGKPKVTVGVQTPITVTKTVPVANQATVSIVQKESSDSPSFMPDFGESLLEAKVPTKKASVGTVKAKSTVKAKTLQATEDVIVRVPEESKVFKIEINGRVYLRYDKYLYDEQSHNRVGSITNDKFVVNGSNIDIETLSLQKYNETYYNDSENKLYMQVNPEINTYQAVGEITDNEIGLWE